MRILISTCDLLLAQSCMLASMRDFGTMVTVVSFVSHPFQYAKCYS